MLRAYVACRYASVAVHNVDEAVKSGREEGKRAGDGRTMQGCPAREEISGKNGNLEREREREDRGTELEYTCGRKSRRDTNNERHSNIITHRRIFHAHVDSKLVLPGPRIYGGCKAKKVTGFIISQTDRNMKFLFLINCIEGDIIRFISFFFLDGVMRYRYG